MRLLWLSDVLRDAGFDVHVEPGWETRGREIWGPVKAIVAHHTATPASASGDYPTLRIVRDGRADVPGPLSQLGLGRSGKVYVIASGRANHAGSGSHPEFTGSSQSVGIEAEHPGGSASWPRVQYDAYVALCAVLADHLDIPTRLVVGHKEWAPGRKVDPNFDMDEFRERIATLEDEMSVPDYAKAAVAKAVAGGFLYKGTEEQLVPRYDLMVWLDRLGALDDFHVDESGDVKKLHDQLADLRRRVDGLSVKGLPHEEVVTIVRNQ